MIALRTKVRRHILKQLKGRTRAGDNVVSNRSTDSWEEHLPAISLYFKSESLDDLDEAPVRMKRTMNLEIECIDKGHEGESLSDRLDFIGEQVENILTIDDMQNGLVDHTTLRSVQIETDSDGEIPIGSIRLFFDVIYFSCFPRESEVLPSIVDLEGIDTQWQVGHHDDEPTMAEADRAKDKLDY